MAKQVIKKFIGEVEQEIIKLKDLVERGEVMDRFLSRMEIIKPGGTGGNKTQMRLEHTTLLNNLRNKLNFQEAFLSFLNEIKDE